MIQFLIGTVLGFRIARRIWIEMSKPSAKGQKRLENKPAAPSPNEELRTATNDEIEKAVSNVEDYYEPIDVKPKPAPKPIKAKATVAGKAPKKPAPTPKKADIKVPEKPEGFKGSMDDLIEDDPLERGMENDPIEGSAPLEDKPEDEEGA